MIATALLELRDRKGARACTMSIAALPTRNAEVPVDRSKDSTRPRCEPPIQLREASTYRYAVQAPLAGVRLEPVELFDPDDPSWLTGRLRTQQYVGDVSITASDYAGTEIGSAPVLIRAAKLEHEREYQRMLRDIADIAAEAVLQGFAPATARTAISPSRAPRLLYQQFAILQARLADEELQDAIAEVVHRPHHEWIDEVELRPAGRPIRAGAGTARALTGPGPRVRVSTPVGRLDTIPATIPSRRTEDTVDTISNRFVKFALTHWRELAARVEDALSARSTGAPTIRGLASVRGVIDALDDVLAEPMFRKVGRLHEFPTSNQILLKREGYRQLFSTFALIESSLELRLELDDAIQPSQRNIATLYEYWTFLKLAGVLGEICGEPRGPLELFETDSEGLSLGLRSGRQSKSFWDVSVGDRRLRVGLYFNRTFGLSQGDGDGSWSRPMRPDSSVLIRPLSGRTRVDHERDLDVWLHFDAKYKVDWQVSQFDTVHREVAEETASEDEQRENFGVSRRDDLLKMHAYRDAIRRSAGAYVLFPGTSSARRFREYVELIPGLGAFPLRPGDDSGVSALRRFLKDVLLHAADQATSEERHRFWQARMIAGPSGSDRDAVDFLDRPPADTHVLVGWVPDARQWRWIEETDQYVVALPTDDGAAAFRAEELAAPLILLFGAGRAVIFERRGAWAIADDRDLEVLGYPDPVTRMGVLCRLIPVNEQPSWLIELPLTDLLARSKDGAPVLLRWSDLVRREDRAQPTVAARRHKVPKPGRYLEPQPFGATPDAVKVDEDGGQTSDE